MIRISRFLLTGALLILFLINAAPDLSAAECFSRSYSLQQGRGVFEEIVPRDLADGEYQALEELFQSIVGEWAGNATVVVCEGSKSEVRKEIDEYLIKAEGKTDSYGQLTLKTTLSSRKKRTKHYENLHLFLSEKRLTLEPNMVNANIELISVSSDKLAYVKNVKSRSGSGAPLAKETVTTISKPDNASLMVEKLFYLQGRLISTNTWHLKRK